MTSPWSGVSTSFLSEGTWSIGQGADAPDRQLYRKLLREILTQQARPKLLEIGFGSGIDVLALSEEGLLSQVEYTGYDFTPEFVDYLLELLPNTRFEVRDLLELDDKAVADIVWCRHVLEHVADGQKALENIWRTTDQYALISWFIRPTWSEVEVRTWDSDGFIHQLYSARQIIEWINDLGAHLYRFDVDHHSTRGSVWLLSRNPEPWLAQIAHQFLSSADFLKAVIPVPPPRRDRESRLYAVLEDASAGLTDLTIAVQHQRTDEIPPILERATKTIVRSELALTGTSLGRIKEMPGLRVPLEGLDQYDRFVFWGFNSSLDSIRHIYRHYIRVLRILGRETVWLDDSKDSRKRLKQGDLVFAVDVEGQHLRSLLGVHYVLHNFDASHPVWEGLDEECFIRLQVYTQDAEQYGVPWGPVRRYQHESRTLFQPWGTDLLPDEFEQPVFNAGAAQAVFVGAVWDDNGLGNVHAIDELSRVLHDRYIDLRLLTHISDAENVTEVRRARIAPAFAGQWQVDHNYLPCRVFKNVSYGALGITNVPKFRELFGDHHVPMHSISSMVDYALDMSEQAYLDMVSAQQEIVKNYTYLDSLKSIGKAFAQAHA